MRKLVIIVEGRAEVEFVKRVLMPHLAAEGVYNVLPIPIRTSSVQKGGFSNYEHLKNDIIRNLRSDANAVVSTFVDFFRFPKGHFPNRECFEKNGADTIIDCIEAAIRGQFDSEMVVPYVQKHEFEALLFSSNKGFEKYFEISVADKTASIISKFDNPEDINSTPDGAPSKRLEAINPSYDKVNDGVIIALEIGIETILQKCPRFAAWVQTLIDKTKTNTIE